MLSTEQPISAVIVTRNEERCIEACLQSVLWCNEIIVLDSGSTDSTLEIVRRYTSKIHHRDFNGFGEQKQAAVQLASNQWVLCVDADEIVTPELASSIRKVLSTTTNVFAYKLTRVLLFMDRVFATSSGGTDYPVRLFHTQHASYSQHKVHEFVQTTSDIGKLDGVLQHHSYRDLQHYIEKFNTYTSLAADEAHSHSKQRSIAATFLLMPVMFLKHYLVKQHYRNGYPGLVWSVMSTVYSFVKVAKLRERSTR